ncbi:hypothetical protein, partial [Mycobacterium persicum]|uniref:hypothetical protein n=1 Tax=Mycobacterium persicum TaxID=1487726 RepID=UPI001F07363D
MIAGVAGQRLDGERTAFQLVHAVDGASEGIHCGHALLAGNRWIQVQHNGVALVLDVGNDPDVA